MSSETKEVRELNGKKSSTNSPLNSNSTKQPLDVTPETSDDDSSKLLENVPKKTLALSFSNNYLYYFLIMQLQKRISTNRKIMERVNTKVSSFLQLSL